MSYHADEVKDPREFVPEDKPIVIVIGAMAHGSVSTVISNGPWCNCIV